MPDAAKLETCSVCGANAVLTYTSITNEGTKYFCAEHAQDDLTVFLAQGVIDAESARLHDPATCEECQRRRIIMELADGE